LILFSEDERREERKQQQQEKRERDERIAGPGEERGATTNLRQKLKVSHSSCCLHRYPLAREGERLSERLRWQRNQAHDYFTFLLSDLRLLGLSPFPKLSRSPFSSCHTDEVREV
jgi:hypothetical protein